MRLLLCLLGALLVSGCDSRDTPSTSPHVLGTTAFDRPVRLEVYGTNPELADSALRVAKADLRYIAEVSHPWRPGALRRTNELLGLASEFSANPSGLPMIALATELYRQSHGHFNPAMGRLQELWGFHQDDLDLVLPAEPVALAEVLEAAPSMEDIRIEGIRMHSRNPYVQLDYGPFAVGYGLDTARLRLQEAGILQARLQTDNAVVLLGQAAHATTIPHYPGLQLLLRADEALYTVTIRDRFYELDGRLIHAYLSPFDGHPVRGIASLSVIHPSAATAAAQAQALLIAGTDGIPSLAHRMAITHYLVQHDDGRLFASAAMRERLGDPHAVDTLTFEH
jgi:FAD:protein FMN transferase